MSKCTIVFITMLLALWAFPAFAGDLSFPTTEDEIVEALSIKDGTTVYEGVAYESEKGRVYKVISGKRYRLRGLQGIVDSKIVPKAGALINFEFDSAKILPGSYQLLDEFVKALKGGLADTVVVIAGHTDSKGSMEYNKNLSVQRAQAVEIYLTAHHGVSANRLIVKGFGETKPIASNDTDADRFKNRRVEFIRIE